MELPHFSYVLILSGDIINILYWNLKIHFSLEEAYSLFLVGIFLLAHANTESASEYSQMMKPPILHRKEITNIRINRTWYKQIYIRKPVLLLSLTKQSLGE